MGSDPLAAYRERLAGTDAPDVRRCYAAARLVMRSSYGDVPHSAQIPGDPGEIVEHVDWKATLDQRRRLDSLGFGIGEAMDTAQRFEVGWPVARRLIEECGRLGPRNGFVAGASHDDLSGPASPGDIVSAVAGQVRFIQAHGGVPILLPLAHLARALEDEVVATYAAILDAVAGPLLVHWLGEQFVPELAGYFPGDSFARVMALDPGKVRGAKLSLLDPARERALRDGLLASGQVVFTGDDLSFAGLIAEDAPPPTATSELDGHALALGPFSHALLGILDGIAEPASLALGFLALGDARTFHELLDPCEDLGRHVFGAPTPLYKAHLAHIAWREGRQDNPFLPNHVEQEVDAASLRRTEELARRARLSLLA